MEDLKVSVIIPIYKVEKYINQCINSVVNQTYKNIEIILVDDGSPDKCPNICDNYAKRDERIKVIHKENGGVSSARNAGIKMAVGNYGIFVDSDDYWSDENGLELLIKRLHQTQADILSFGYQKYDEENRKTTSYFSEDITYNFKFGNKVKQLDELTKNNLYIASACNKLIRMTLLQKTMFRQGVFSEDVEWCARLMVKANSLDFVNQNLYCYRQHSESITHSICAKSCTDLKNAVLECAKIAEASCEDIQEYVYRYTAYQFASFIAVQAFVKKMQTDCINSLEAYTYILQYFGKNKKIKSMYWGTRIFGLKVWCFIIKSTRGIWDKLR